MTHIIGWNLCNKNRKIAIFGCVQAARAAFFATSSLLSVSAVAQAAAAPSVNAAHSTDDTGLTDIVITAQKRSENLQRVPVSVAVVTADQLLESGVSDIRDLKLVAPGVDMQTLTGFAIPIIRGVGNRATISGVEPPNALYIDGVYYAASTANLLSFNNISQIEVLKGPQGTLFGRNATGGLMQITTREPSDILKADLNLTAANYETITGNGYVTGGIASDVVADFAVHASTMGKGYGTNLFNGKDVYKVNKDIGFRSKWLVKFGDQTEARFIGDYSEQKNSNNALRIKKGTTVPPPFGPTYGGSPWDIDADYQPLTRVKTGGVSLRIDHKIGDYSLMSLSAYRHTDTAVDFDLDYTETHGRYAIFRQKDWQFSQEIQALSPTGQFIEWVVGAYYFRSDSSLNQRANFAGPAISPVALVKEAFTDARQGTDSISGFGQANIWIVNGLKTTVGLRYTSEKRMLEDASQINTLTSGQKVVAIPLKNESKRFNKLTWRFSVDYQINQDVMTYASYNRGFKSGGFNTVALALPAFDPEVIDAYEVGVKAKGIDGNLRVNASGFWYDYANVQVLRTVSASTGLYNSGDVKLYGGEVEFEARLVDALIMRIGYQYAYGEYKNFPGAIIATPRLGGGYSIGVGDASGNRTALTPKSTLSMNLNYVVPIYGKYVTFNAGYYYNSGFYNEPDNTTRQPSYSLFNASVKAEISNSISILVWGNNLTNKAISIFDGIQNFGATGANRIGYAPPRTYGVTTNISF